MMGRKGHSLLPSGKEAFPLATALMIFFVFSTLPLWAPEILPDKWLLHF